MLVLLLVKACGGTWRLKQKCCSAGNPVMAAFYHLLWRAWMGVSASSIEPKTYFAGEPCFPHGVKSIFISGDARFGKDCVIFQQVTVGSNYLPGSRRLGAPKIGDHCFIGAGAILVGGITVGDRCRVAAGAVVFQDVPDDSIVLGAAPRIVTREDPLNNHYYTWMKGGWHFYSEGTWSRETKAEIIELLEASRDPH